MSEIPDMNKRFILGLHADNGKENGNYYLGFRVRQMLC